MGRGKRKKGQGDLAASDTQPAKKIGRLTMPEEGGGSTSRIFRHQTAGNLAAAAAAVGQHRRAAGGSHHQLPTITRGPESLRQLQGSPLNRVTSGNQGAISKVDYLSKIAKWAAAAEIPSLGAFLGERLATACESIGVPSPVLDSQCQRCETVLLPGVNCSVRVVALKKKKKRRRSKTATASATTNIVVYQCHFCKHGNQKPGTPKEHVKTKLAQAAARAQMKDLASATSLTMTPVQEVKETRGGDQMPISALAKLVCPPSSPASALQVEHATSSSKKRKRKGWTGLKAMTTLSIGELAPPDRLGLAEDHTSPLHPRNKDQNP